MSSTPCVKLPIESKNQPLFPKRIKYSIFNIIIWNLVVLKIEIVKQGVIVLAAYAGIKTVADKPVGKAVGYQLYEVIAWWHRDIVVIQY